jgi:MFS family permease
MSLCIIFLFLPKLMKSRFSGTVWLLGCISLLADISSELLYPVLPVYLRQAGYSMLALGVLEGVANVIAGVSKGYFGHLSDVQQRRHPFVRWGYGLSSFGKLLMLGAPDLFRLYVARAMDRLGKGIRSAPRDAMLAAESTSGTRAAVFGFHRAMDTLGAAIGPLLAMWWLAVHPGAYADVFLLAFLPSLLSVVVTFFVKDKISDRPAVSKAKVGFFEYFSYWGLSGGQYKKLMVPLMVLAIANSPDTFLLVALKESGCSDVEMIGAYVSYNLLYALLSTPVGMLADKIGRMKVLLAGLLLFGLTYSGMALNTSLAGYFVLFALYAMSMSCMESVVKAIITGVVPEKERGQALGFYASFNSIGSLIAGVWAGLLWKITGASTVFAISAVAGLLAAGMLVGVKPEKKAA